MLSARAWRRAKTSCATTVPRSSRLVSPDRPLPLRRIDRLFSHTTDWEVKGVTIYQQK